MGSCPVAQRSMLGVFPMPMRRSSCRSGPSRLSSRAATSRPQTRAQVTCRIQSGAAQPSRIAASHRCATRSKALS
eukprot:7230326-Lingulodinium_polyedra.AAC.1